MRQALSHMLRSGVLGLVLSGSILCTTVSSQTDPFRSFLITVDNIPAPTFGKVHAILKDRRGFFWFGSTNGLYKYDGYDVRVVDIGPARYEGSNFVTSMYQSGDSALVLATWKGLWMFDLSTEVSAPFLPQVVIGDGRISAITEDSHHRLWIGSLTGGLFMHDRLSGKTRSYAAADGLNDSAIACLFVDRDGVVWIGTHHGLNSLDPSSGRIEQYHSRRGDAQSLSSDEINVICDAGRDSLWIGTRHGLDLFDTRSGTVRRFVVTPYGQNEVGAMTSDPAGRLWLSLFDAGLFSYVDGTFTPFAEEENVPKGVIDPYSYTVYCDPTSTKDRVLLWIGTRDGGVDRVRIARNPFANYRRGRNLPLRGVGAVLSMCEDRQGILWVGLWGGGLNALRFRNGSYELVSRYTHDPSDPATLPDTTVNSLALDRSNALWVGTSDGLAVLDSTRRRFRVYKHDPFDSTSLPNNGVNKVYVDHLGRVWACTDGGLARLVPGSPPYFINYLHRPGDVKKTQGLEGGNRVSDVVEDSANAVWASMYGGGLNRIATDGTYSRFLSSQDSSGTHENWIYLVQPAPGNKFWIETGGGVLQFDPATGQYSPFEAEEFHVAHVFGILVDHSGVTWMSTGIGLIRMEPGSGTLRRYDASHGLEFKELLSDFYRSRSGKVLVGGLDGFAEFNPESITSAGPPPAIAITRFSILDKPMPASVFSSPRIELTHDQNFISFSFAALDYSDPKRNRYAYRLIGVDPDWVDAGHRTIAPYTHLPSGSYTFQVKGCNSENIWNEAGASVAIIIAPPYWETWWFRIVASAITALILLAAYRVRLRRLLEVERLRLRIADDLHDDIGSNLSTIAMVSRAVQHSEELGPAAKRRIAEIYDTAVSTAEGMKDIVWFIKPQNDSLDDLLLRMKDTAGSLLSGIGYDFQAPKSQASTKIGIDFKRNFFLAFKEILTNVARHAGATEVRIEVFQHDGTLELNVRDNGRGFDPAAAEAHRKGNGLPSLRTRAENIGGAFEISSRPGGGTEVKFRGMI